MNLFVVLKTVDAETTVFFDAYTTRDKAEEAIKENMAEFDTEPADYEIHELRSALANVAKARPLYRQKSVSDSIEMFVSGAFTSMEGVIHDRGAAKFADAYATINAGCNACHTSLGQSQVVIRTPEQPTYPDQEFRPQK